MNWLIPESRASNGYMRRLFFVSGSVIFLCLALVEVIGQRIQISDRVTANRTPNIINKTAPNWYIRRFPNTINLAFSSFFISNYWKSKGKNNTSFQWYIVPKNIFKEYVILCSSCNFCWFQKLNTILTPIYYLCGYWWRSFEFWLPNAFYLEIIKIKYLRSFISTEQQVWGVPFCKIWAAKELSLSTSKSPNDKRLMTYFDVDPIIVDVFTTSFGSGLVFQLLRFWRFVAVSESPNEKSKDGDSARMAS